MTIIVLLFLLYIVYIIKNDTVRNFTKSIWIMLPILKWSWYDVIVKIKNDIKNLNEINDLLNENGKYTLKKLEFIQSKIYNYRKSAFIIPDLFYNIFKEKDNSIVNIIISKLIKIN